MVSILYQIGDLPIYDIASGIGGKGVELGLGRGWETPTTTFTNIGGNFSFLPATRAIPQSPKLSFKATFLQKGLLYPQDAVEHLKSFGGRRNIPFIAFRYQEIDISTCGGRLPITWMLNYGEITDIKETSETVTTGAQPYAQMEVDLSAQIGINWRALPLGSWEYRDWNRRYTDPYNVTNFGQTPDKLFIHPPVLPDLRENGFFFKWQAAKSDIDPVYWGEKYLNGRIGGFGISWSDYGSYEFFANPRLFSGTTASLYAFKGLQNTGTISITIRRDTGLFSDSYVSEVSTLDLAQLNTDLQNAGYGGLYSNDILYAGLLDPFPGYILRDGVKIVDVLPKWSYPGTYVGEVGRGYNLVNFSSTFTGGSVAMIQDYGIF